LLNKVWGENENFIRRKGIGMLKPFPPRRECHEEEVVGETGKVKKKANGSLTALSDF